MVKRAKTMKKRPLSEWNMFVMEVKKQNPEKMFKDVLVLAGQLKKKGVKYADYVKNKTEKVAKKVQKLARKTISKKQQQKKQKQQKQQKKQKQQQKKQQRKTRKN
jgi:hypothetical protein